MAVRLTRSNSQKLTVGSAPDYNSGYTFLIAFRPETVSETQILCAIRNNISNVDLLEMNQPVGAKLRIQSIVAGANDITGGGGGQPAMSAGTWYYVAMQRSSATGVEIFQGTTPSNIVSLIADTTPTVASRVAANTVEIGGLISSSNYANGRFRYARLYDAVLSLADIKAAAGTEWGDWPLPGHTDLNDISGNSRHLSATGTPTTEDDDSAVWGGTFTFAGTVSGYADPDGAGLEVKIFKASDNSYLGSVTTTAGGAYSFSYSNNTDNLYAVVHEDNTHIGASRIGTAQAA